MEIIAAILAWFVVGCTCLVISRSVTPIREASIEHWKWYHFTLAVLVWPWFLIELVIAHFKGYFK